MNISWSESGMEGEEEEDNDEPEDCPSICQLTALSYAGNSYHDFYIIVNFCTKLPAQYYTFPTIMYTNTCN